MSWSASATAPEDMGYRLLGWLEDYEESGEPFGHMAQAFALAGARSWVRFSWEGCWTTVSYHT